MHHAVLAGSEFDERAHAGQNPHDDAYEHIPHFGIVRDRLDDRFGALCRGNVAVASDAHRAVLFDVDLRARLLDDFIDDFALLADHVADLLGTDFKGDDLGRVLGKMIGDFGNAREHLIQNESSAFLRLRDRVEHDLFGNALDLDVHLNGRDALFRCPPL